jgi:D-serine dehydratase
MPKSFDDAEHWRRRAEEARPHADQMNDEKSREMMLGIAVDYDRLAARAEVRSRKTVAAIKIATPGPWATESEKQA